MTTDPRTDIASRCCMCGDPMTHLYDDMPDMPVCDKPSCAERCDRKVDELWQEFNGR